jgi:hypothetical protein
MALAATAAGRAQAALQLDGALRGWSLHGTTTGNFAMRDGILRVEGPSGWLRSDRQYGDFVFRTEFRFLTPDADSGVFLRAADNTSFMRGWPNGSYQVQVRVPTTPSPLPPLGGIFRHGTPAGETSFDADLVRKLFRGINEWHDLEIEVAGDVLIARLDGQQVTRAANIGNAPGYIGIQGEAGALEYRNIQITPRP